MWERRRPLPRSCLLGGTPRGAPPCNLASHLAALLILVAEGPLLVAGVVGHSGACCRDAVDLHLHALPTTGERETGSTHVRELANP